MRFTLSIILLTLALVFVNPATVSAHSLQTDGNIGGIIHVDPEDDPIIGVPSAIYLEIKDREGMADFAACDCKIVISRGGEAIFSARPSITPQEPGTATFTTTYTFTARDIYVISLEGTLSSGTKFELRYDFRVSREQGTGSSLNLWVLVAATAVIAVTGGILLLAARKPQTKG